MILPTISRYAESARRPQGLFRTLDEPEFEKEPGGEPSLRAGGNAAVFRILCGGKRYAMKCYTKPHGRTATICGYLEHAGEALTYPAIFLPDEFFVYDESGTGQYCDILLTEWGEGHSLEYEIRRALHYADAERLAVLAKAFDSMSLDLLGRPWAHGDLKPENIIVTPAGGMKLIDYDAVYIPMFDGMPTEETGTPHYQHPLRDASCYDKFIDDYSIALISATLHALACEPSLNKRFGNKDILLFDPAEIYAGRSAGLEAVRAMAAGRGDAGLYRLCGMLSSAGPAIDGLAGLLGFIFGSGTSPADEELLAFNNGTWWGYALADGRTVIPPMFETALEFSEGLAAVSIGGWHHFIGTTGRTAINCSGYDHIKPFREGAAAVRHGGLWGYIDMECKEIVTPQFSKASSVRGGTARVRTADGTEKEITIRVPFRHPANNAPAICTRQE